MSKCHSLPGIIDLRYTNCATLQQDIVYRALVGINIELDSHPTSITFLGDAVCEVEENFDNNIQVERTKLTFQTLEELPTHLHLAFLVKTADGEWFVIGSKERPYPTVKVTRSTGQPDGDPSARKYEVSFTARKSLALCSEFLSNSNEPI